MRIKPSSMIYKYPLNDFPITDKPITMPLGSHPIKVDLDGGGNPCIWVIFESLEAETEDRYFKIFGTGHEIPEGHWYIGTFSHGIFVWHVFEHRG